MVMFDTKNLVIHKGENVVIKMESWTTMVVDGVYRLDYSINGGTAVTADVFYFTETESGNNRILIVIPPTVTSLMLEGSGDYMITQAAVGATSGVATHLLQGTLVVKDVHANVVPDSRIVRTDSRG